MITQRKSMKKPVQERKSRSFVSSIFTPGKDFQFDEYSSLISGSMDESSMEQRQNPSQSAKRQPSDCGFLPFILVFWALLSFRFGLVGFDSFHLWHVGLGLLAFSPWFPFIWSFGPCFLFIWPFGPWFACIFGCWRGQNESNKIRRVGKASWKGYCHLNLCNFSSHVIALWIPNASVWKEPPLEKTQHTKP